MNQPLQTVRVGLFFILGVALIYVVYAVIGDRKLHTDSGYALLAVFNDIKTITPGADVRLAGVRIGVVEETRLVDGRGQLVLRINPQVQIPKDSVASISVASLLGQNYISVGYGREAAYLQANDQIATRPSVDFNDVLNEVRELGERINNIAGSFEGLGGGDMGNFFTNLNTLVQDNRAQVDRIVDNVEALTQKINEGQGTLGRLVNDPQLYDQALATVTEIRAAAEDARRVAASAEGVLADVRSGQGTLGKLLYDDAIANELQASVDNIRAFTDKLNSSEGTLGKLVTDDELYVELRSLLQRADQALNSVGDTAPISAIGAASGALF